MLNAFGQYRTTLDGLDIHFLHVRSPEPDALPLLITHGWPGSVIEFHKVIAPLTNPAAYGGNPRDAFHVIAPRSEEHTSELQSLMRTSYAVFCLTKKTYNN